VKYTGAELVIHLFLVTFVSTLRYIERSRCNLTGVTRFVCFFFHVVARLQLFVPAKDELIREGNVCSLNLKVIYLNLVVIL
jgi:hypothetical protein